MIESIIEETMKEVKNRIDTLPLWQQDVLERLIKEAVELAYKQGRDDQKYVSEGPKITLYYE